MIFHTLVARAEGREAPVTAAIITGAVGGVALVCALVLGLLLVQRRRLRRLNEESSDEEKGNEKQPKYLTINITRPASVYSVKSGRLHISLPPTTAETLAQDSPPSCTSKWKLKRVPVPRLSRLPSSPQTPRSRSWLSRIPTSPRNSRKSRHSGLRNSLQRPVPAITVHV